MNKKADLGDYAMFFSFFLMLVIISAGITAGVYLNFGKEYDFRKVDADILNYKIKTCLSSNDFNFQLPQEELEKELLEKCRLNNNTKENHLVMIKLNGEIKYGSESYETTCSLSEKNKNYPVCSTSTLTKEQNKFTILTGSSQWAKIEAS